MRARVLVTNGLRTVDLFWLHHDGKDVYCGPTKFDTKRSYHQSGKVHSTTNGTRNHEGWCQPLAALKGQFHLTTMSIGFPGSFVESAGQQYEYGGGKSDTLLLIDSRAIPPKIQVNIAIGLLEPGNFEALRPLTSNHDIGEADSLASQQILLATSVEPWVYAAVMWWKNAT